MPKCNLTSLAIFTVVLLVERLIFITHNIPTVYFTEFGYSA